MRGLYHIHLRKRISKNLEPFPAKNRPKRLLDAIVLTVGILGPLASLPQIFKIYLLQNAIGLSAISYVLWVLMDIPWILYGIAHRERPITFTYFAWLIVNCVILVGIFLYGDGAL